MRAIALPFVLVLAALWAVTLWTAPLWAAAAAGAATEETSAPTPARDTVSKEDVQKLAAQYYAEGLQACSAGKLRPARRLFEAALKLDPSHTKAKSILQAVEKKLGITDRDRLNEKLKTRIAKVEFKKATVKEVVGFLAREAEVNIVFDASALRLLASEGEEPGGVAPDADSQPEVEEAEGELPPLAPPRGASRPAPVRTDLITIHLKNVPLGEVLKYVLRYKGLKYVVEDYAILIVPVNWVAEEDLVMEFFHLTTSGTGPRTILNALGEERLLGRPGGY